MSHSAVLCIHILCDIECNCECNCECSFECNPNQINLCVTAALSSASLRSLQCRKEVKGICYYSPEDCTLGQFLIGQCFNLTLRCHSTKCKRHILDHTLYYMHNNGRLTITVDQIPYALPNPNAAPDDDEENNMDHDKQILMWRRSSSTRKCTPCVIMSQKTWQYSFGKYLESFFHRRDGDENPMNKDDCEQLFGFRNLVAVFKFDVHKPYSLSSSHVGAYNASVYGEEKMRQVGYTVHVYCGVHKIIYILSSIHRFHLVSFGFIWFHLVSFDFI